MKPSVRVAVALTFLFGCCIPFLNRLTTGQENHKTNRERVVDLETSYNTLLLRIVEDEEAGNRRDKRIHELEKKNEDLEFLLDDVKAHVDNMEFLRGGLPTKEKPRRAQPSI